VSAAWRLANPHRIKAAHRWRRKCSTGHSLYANDNPYRYKDPDGRIPLDTQNYVSADVVEAGASALANGLDWVDTHILMPLGPDGGAELHLAVAPMVGVLREAAAAAKTAEAANDAEQGAVAAEDAARATARETGSYTNLHESGKTYSGKGSRARSQVSARRVEKETGDKHIATDWTPASNDRAAFKQESGRIDANGGPASSGNYNKIESPGKKMCQQDKDC
jgi:hypothetical protein